MISEGKSATARYSWKNVMCDPTNRTRAYYLKIEKIIIAYCHREGDAFKKET